jgi:hypothetical protein
VGAPVDGGSLREDVHRHLRSVGVPRAAPHARASDDLQIPTRRVFSTQDDGRRVPHGVGGQTVELPRRALASVVSSSATAVPAF